MSRFRRLAHSVASGYLNLAAAALYVLASVPLALHYLSRKQFGLWALMSNIGAYLALIDLGMSGSVARLLVDHKDQRLSGSYGSLIKTGSAVLVTQALVVFLAGFAFAPSICRLFAIEPDLQSDFIQLLRWQGAIVALGFATRIFSHLLQAHQRMDIQNYGQIGALALNLALLWLFFRASLGVFSLVWAGLLAGLGSALVCLAACFQLRLFPPQGAWGRVSGRYFKEIFLYGADLFLVAVGTQLILASQTMVITRRVGLEAAAAWNVGTRTFTLVSQAIWRIMTYSQPAFSEMIVRGERLLLRERFRDILIVSASASAFAAITFASCNSLFVSLWTSLSARAPINWPAYNDVLLALWMIVLAVQSCHNNFVLITKQIRFMRYIYFVEGCVFVMLAWVFSPWGGLPAIIACSVLCSSVFTTPYGVWRTCIYFGLPVREVAGGWLAPLARVIASFAPLAALAWLAARPLTYAVRLALMAALCCTVGLAIFLRYGLPLRLRQEILSRAPGFVGPCLKGLFKLAP